MRINRQQLILDHYSLVWAIARRLARRFPGIVDVEDLASIGVLGLIDAADRFDPLRAGSFAVYAQIRIQGSILDGMRSNDFVPRSVRRRVKRIVVAQERLQLQLNRQPTQAELADELGVTQEQFAKLECLARIVNVVSFDEFRMDSEERLIDTLASSDKDPADIIEANSNYQLYQLALDQLAPRDREVLRLYYSEAQSLREIGQALGITESRVSQLHTRARTRLVECLAA